MIETILFMACLFFLGLYLDTREELQKERDRKDLKNSHYYNNSKK